MSVTDGRLVPYVHTVSAQRECHELSKAWFPGVHASPVAMRLYHLATGAAGEAGELLNKVKKWGRGMLPDLDTPPHAGHVDAIADEMADVLVYLLVLAEELDIDLGDAMERKVRSNHDRFGEYRRPR